MAFVGRGLSSRGSGTEIPAQRKIPVDLHFIVRLRHKASGIPPKSEISDNLAGDKRLIVLTISVLHQTIAARSYENTYNLAGILMSHIYCNLLTINTLHLTNVIKSSARLSDI